MNGSNLQSANGRLQDALKMLLLAWQNTRESWRDEQARSFEEEHLNPMIEQIGITSPSLSHMSQVIGRAGRDCDE